ncbi:MAG: asparagine synthase (glutamine-hydrolyzing) [Bacteroidetes bacterium]|nr:asparagine synthase (glutamine-hydrolyzing) [Bacteroidota bacterium]
MCGICGIYNLNKKPVEVDKLNKMAKLIRHRGPDDEGFLLVNTTNKVIRHCHEADSIPEIKAQTQFLHNDFQADLGLGFRRLSILDLSPKGHQPMSIDDGKYWIVFNGEIYNYIELRQELKQLGHTFDTATDTEVILMAYKQWGTACLNRFNGMWSFALWDSTNQMLFCARDRFGVKPFNYYYDGNQFIFGSEIKQILANDIEKTVNEEVIYKSLKIGSYLINSDSSYFNTIKILPHSHFIIIKEGKMKIERYYDLPTHNFASSSLNFEDSCNEYRNLFVDAVKLRMRSDVEVGSALSGGLDSSAIVATAVGCTDKQFKTFSSYYTHAPQYDERKWIQLVTDTFQTKPYFVSASAETVMQELSDITWHHDFPVPGSSPISQNYVMKIARENGVTVLLDGQGSDEITGGYHHAFYRYYAYLLKSGKLLRFAKEYPDYLKYNPKGSTVAKLIKLAAVLFFSESSLYKQEAKRNLQNPLSVSFDDTSIFDNIKDLKTDKLSNFLYNQMMSTSIQTLLHFEDRNSMAHSIESRVPFLDYRLVEFAFSLPPEYKIHKHLGKYIHREALKSIVPSAIMDRNDKVGFLAPGEHFWLRNEMKPFIENIFESNNFKNRSIYNHQLIRAKYREYQNGNGTYANMIWQIMALEIWFNRFVD